MKRPATMAMVLSGFLALAATGASAHGTPCCAPKACPAGQFAAPGSSPGGAQCCTTEGVCTSAPNAGWACFNTLQHLQDDPASLAENPAVAGCIDGEEGVCVGGAVTEEGPDGCVGLGVGFVAGMNPEASSTDCTNAAVDTCCASGACEIPPPAEPAH